MGGQLRCLTHGTLYLDKKNELPIEKRLALLHLELTQVIKEYRPHVVAVEKVFFAKNAMSALKLGQARGVVLLAASQNGLEIVEYAATEIKRSIAGFGHADKKDLAQVLGLILGGIQFETPDASDGLALAVHHAQRNVHLSVASALNRNSSRKVKTLADAVKHRVKPEQTRD